LTYLVQPGSTRTACAWRARGTASTLWAARNASTYWWPTRSCGARLSGR